MLQLHCLFTHDKKNKKICPSFPEVHFDEISNYKNIINQIRLKVLKRINPQSNLVSSPSNQNLNRVLQDELNISTTTIDPPNYQPTHGGDKVLNSYRLGLDLTAHDDQR